MLKGILIWTLITIACLIPALIFSADNTESYITISEEAFTVSYSFESSAHVPENDCNTCIRDKRPSECLIVCEQVVDIY